MREIKFRAWDKEYKRMSYQFNPVCHGEYNFFNFNQVKIFCPNWILMQCTGLKDKKGKEIYEGDIFTSIFERKWGGNNSEYSGIIIWKDDIGAWGFYFTGHSPKTSTLLPKKRIIIGNIYENPDLIKKEI